MNRVICKNGSLSEAKDDFLGQNFTRELHFLNRTLFIN